MPTQSQWFASLAKWLRTSSLVSSARKSHVQSFLNTMGGSVHSFSRNSLRPYPADSSSPRCCSFECVVNRYLLVITILVHSSQPYRMRKSSIRSCRDVAQRLRNLRLLKPYGRSPLQKNSKNTARRINSPKWTYQCKLSTLSCQLFAMGGSLVSPVWYAIGTRAIEKCIGSTHSEERIDPDQYTRGSLCVANRSSYFHFVQFVVDVVDEH